MNDAYWPYEQGVLFTKVCTPVFVRKFCVRKILCYVRNAVQKTFLRTKIVNSFGNIRMIAAVV